MIYDQKKLQLLGLAQRAGKLISGTELVLAGVKKGQVKLVVLANDVSDRTKKDFENKCSYYNVPLVQAFSTDELSWALGKTRRVCGITDQGFRKSFEKQERTI